MGIQISYDEESDTGITATVSKERVTLSQDCYVIVYDDIDSFNPIIRTTCSYFFLEKGKKVAVLVDGKMQFTVVNI